MTKRFLILFTIMVAGGLLTLGGCSDDEGDNGTGGTTELSIISVGPHDGADSVASDVDIWAVFSRELDSASVSSSAFYVTSSTGTVGGTILVTGQTVTLTPDLPLQRSRTYTAHATTAITDLDGYALPQEESWTFSTIPLETIELLGSVPMPGGALNVVVPSTYAYVADVDQGLQIVWVGDPTHPSIVTTYDSIASTGGLAAQDEYAYLCGVMQGAGPSNGLHVIDLSGQQPVRAGSLEGFGWIPDIAVDGVYAFLADYDVGLQVVSVFNPAAPTLVNTLTVQGSPYGVDVAGSYVYLTTEWTEWAEWQGLHIFDITNPLEPTLTGSLATPDRAVDVHVAGGYAYLAADSAGLRIIDISNPAQPVEVGHYTATDAAAFDIFVSGDYAYIADNNIGVQIFDVSDQTAPSLVASYDTPGSSRGIFVRGSYIYVAAHDGGLQILRFNPGK